MKSAREQDQDLVNQLNQVDVINITIDNLAQVANQLETIITKWRREVMKGLPQDRYTNLDFERFYLWSHRLQGIVRNGRDTITKTPGIEALNRILDEIRIWANASKLIVFPNKYPTE